MNIFRAFESRISDIFGAADVATPFSFRKLSRRAARELEQETYEIEGVDTAPALYTILVSADDDVVMRPCYAQLTQEISSFVEAEAGHKGYVFVGKPVTRFMVDPSLRRGRFAVFANNVDAVTLEKLRQEEEAFLSGFGAFGGAASNIVTPLEAPEPEDAYEKPAEADDSAAGLSIMPDDFVDDGGQVSAPSPVVSEARDLKSTLPEVVDVDANPIVTPLREVKGAHIPEVPEVSAGAPAQVAVPSVAPHPIHNVQDSTVGAAPVPIVEAEPVTCLLIDRQSGRTYIGTAPKTIIGRERTPKGIVLHDPNVSRRHSELTFDGSIWRIHDLGSTNGTLVNDIDVDTSVLRDGDIITLGLLNLEFRES